MPDADKSQTTPPEPAVASNQKMVPEADVLAQKSKAEGLERKLKESEQQWNTERDTLKTQVSASQTSQYAAEAQNKELIEKLSKSLKELEELPKVKAELDSTKLSAGELTKKALEYRRRFVAQSWGISEDTVKDKDMSQLDQFEEALKAVKASGGRPGNYAIGGTGGGAGQESPTERATRIIKEAAEKSGVKLRAD